MIYLIGIMSLVFGVAIGFVVYGLLDLWMHHEQERNHD